MRLLERVAVLLKADAHGVVESLEERSLLLKQYLREAEIGLDRDRARLEALREECKALNDRLERESEAVRRIDEDIALALDVGKEELARFAIRQLLPRRREVEALTAHLEQRRKQIDAAAQRIDEQCARYEELKGRVRSELSLPRDAAPWCEVGAVAEEEVELELMRRRGAGSRP